MNFAQEYFPSLRKRDLQYQNMQKHQLNLHSQTNPFFSMIMTRISFHTTLYEIRPHQEIKKIKYGSLKAKLYVDLPLVFLWLSERY